MVKLVTKKFQKIFQILIVYAEKKVPYQPPLVNVVFECPHEHIFTFTQSLYSNFNRIDFRSKTDILTSIDFIRCFHKFVSRIFSTNFSPLSCWKRKPTPYWSKTGFVFSVYHLPFIIMNISKKNSEFETGETIWWICYLLELIPKWQ